MKAYVGRAGSPAGSISFAVDDSGCLIYTSFEEGEYPDSMEDVLESRGYELVEQSDGEHDGSEKTDRVRAEIEAYTAGERRAFTLATAPVGSDWQLKVWDALGRIPFGRTKTYGEIAEEIGHPGAARAVGRANATNRIPLVVPCHRVVGSDGRLTGFAGGVHLKEKLLDHERSIVSGSDHR